MIERRNGRAIEITAQRDMMQPDEIIKMQEKYGYNYTIGYLQPINDVIELLGSDKTLKEIMSKRQKN